MFVLKKITLLFQRATQFSSIPAPALAAILIGLAPHANADLVGHWTFDNVDNVGEASVSSNLVASSGGAAFTPSGKVGGALSLDGSSYLQVNASQTLAAGMPTGDSSFTVMAFIRTSIGGNFIGRGGIIGWGNYGSAGQVNAFRTAGGGALAHYSWSGAYDLDPVSAPEIFNNMWHHVAATYDSATSTKRIYFNGVEIGTKIVPNLNVQGMNFTVGKTVGSEYFNGFLDDVRVYNTALSITEINSMLILTPQDAIAALSVTVMEMNIKAGISNALDAKLGAALNALDDTNQNNDGAAINSLYAFCSNVEAQRGNKLTEVQANTLIGSVNSIIILLDEFAQQCE